MAADTPDEGGPDAAKPNGGANSLFRGALTPAELNSRDRALAPVPAPGAPPRAASGRACLPHPPLTGAGKRGKLSKTLSQHDGERLCVVVYLCQGALCNA